MLEYTLISNYNTRGQVCLALKDLKIEEFDV